MKKILLIIPSGGVGGIERLVLNFYNSYKSKGLEVKVVKIIKLNNDIVNFGDDEFYLSDVDFGEMGSFERLFFYVKAPWKLRSIIKKHNFTHSLGFGDMPNIFSSLTFTKEYKIVSLHSMKSNEFINDSFLSRLSKLSYKTSYFFLDKVVCISEAVKKDLIENCGFAFKNKLKVIYNPHNTAEIEKMAFNAIENEEEKRIFDKKTILFLGRLTTVKSPWHLLKAYNLLENKHEVNLVFVGDGDPKVLEYLYKLVEQFGLTQNVYFLGRKTNPYQYLSQATVLALSSKYEGTPNVIVEAIVCEVPVVTSNCTDGLFEMMSIKKIEKHEPLITTEAGIVTPSFFNNSLNIPETDEFTDGEYCFAEALALVLNQPEYKMTLKQHKEALLVKFDVEKIASEYLNEKD